MDECEALSTRLAIMVNGAFRCLGSTQHLKNKFGEGYTLIAQIETRGDDEHRITRQSLELARRRSSNLMTINGGQNSQQLQAWEKELQPIKNYIERTFSGCELKDIHAGYVHYHIKNKDKRITWGYMFKKMEEAKAEFRIEAYSIGQTNLEQIFLNFTRSQTNSDQE
jgi:ATP-binding cassette subfamily A (ABC1) protein 3